MLKALIALLLTVVMNLSIGELFREPSTLAVVSFLSGESFWAAICSMSLLRISSKFSYFCKRKKKKKKNAIIVFNCEIYDILTFELRLC